MCRAVSSQRNTPANSPLNGTTALLKILFEVRVKFLGIMGFFVYLHINSFFGSLEDGLSSQGMFGILLPFIIILLIFSPVLANELMKRKKFPDKLSGNFIKN
jgi:hypothetical protein